MHTGIFLLFVTFSLSFTAAGLAIKHGVPEDGLLIQRRSPVVVDASRHVIERKSIIEDVPAPVVESGLSTVTDGEIMSKDDASASDQDPTTILKTRDQGHRDDDSQRRTADLEQRADRHGPGYGRRSDNLEQRADRHGPGYGKRSDDLEVLSERRGGEYGQ
ncbi:uncharacterized protein EKO05_0005936 [Ascochyta rabiei]|uniref:uncharacterized protein n=1 Tax=Didymella rabiei TaxID=5454 RepID=UPI0018FF56EC|nr:uncharacterized protein EKO05_0005936 [Ascochyta rabiei]UPX15490.1 hypothetical protein EKO05_0005936 [Ascochyta rabiei]